MEAIKYIVCIFLLFTSTSYAATTIDAQVVRNQSGSGITQISSGFPVPPGLVTEAMVTGGLIKVTVGGSEVAANVTGLRGRHPDGTLRSVLIQFLSPSSMTQAVYNTDGSVTNAVAAQVIVDDGARASEDPTYITPTITMVTNNDVILATSPTYLVSTRATFLDLLPSGSGTTDEERLYTALAEDRLAIQDYYIGATYPYITDGTARYEEIRAFLSMFLRTGKANYYKKALNDTLNKWITYNTPKSTYVHAQYMNPEGRSDNGATGKGNEVQNPRSFSYAAMYLMTGYRDLWTMVAFFAQYPQGSIFEYTPAITNSSTAATGTIPVSTYDTPRYNYSGRYCGLLAAYYIDATIAFPIYNSTTSVFNWSDRLTWTVDALIASAWDMTWIPYDSGTGTVPAKNTTVSKGSVSATLLGVFIEKNHPMRFVGETMPASGYLLVSGITGGNFSAGALTGISASATGAEVSDYRNGFVGANSHSNLRPNFRSMTASVSNGSGEAGTIMNVTAVSTATPIEVGQNVYGFGGGFTPGMYIVNQLGGTTGGVGTYTVSKSVFAPSQTAYFGTTVPIFQMIFPNNFLVDYYRNVYADSRIPAIIKSNIDAVLANVRLMESGDTYYGVGGTTWGYPLYGKPYAFTNPVTPKSMEPAHPYELPEYARMIQFVLKTVSGAGSMTINGASYATWYTRLIDTANVNPVGILGNGWQWKIFGQIYSWGLESPWLNAQSSLPTPAYRTPTQWNAIPDWNGAPPDLARSGGGGGEAGTKYRFKAITNN
jgi:hypothetical protein